MADMRAKMKVTGVAVYPTVGQTTQENLRFTAVSAKAYPADGSDEDNTYAKFSPAGSISLTVANPALFGKFKLDDTFYIDFTAVQ
ncbi:hypothetical protein [Mesorhizobium sp.]|uniref:hypothetical protein n=1 Tax=Mesorhizobium sp. TaxID=1871066 RepID=UPI000FEA4F63|nr:hypothetical protein [Mesorhizobium sp.]RWO08214.1 MAG: hypothetical protein EOS15_29815 [Mesorhizobium sp.]